MNDVAEKPPGGRGLLIGCLVLSMVFALVLTAVTAFWIGRFNQQLISDMQRQDAEIAQIQRFLNQHPDRYDSITFNRGPGHKYHVEGTVRTEEDLSRLKSELIRLFGEARMEYVIGVSVFEESKEQVPP